MLEPQYINREAIKRVGVLPEKIASAAKLVNGAMGQDWIEEQEAKSSRHPIHDLLMGGGVKSVIQLINLADCLEMFSDKKSIGQ